MRIRADIYVILTNFAYRDPRFELVPGDGWCSSISGFPAI